jgi:hypothetical protein
MSRRRPLSPRRKQSFANSQRSGTTFRNPCKLIKKTNTIPFS